MKFVQFLSLLFLSFLFTIGYAEKSLAATKPKVPGQVMWSCTAFFITTDGYAGTAGHCVKSADKMYLVFGGVAHEATLKIADYTNDVAIIKIDKVITPAFKFSLLDAVKQPIFIIGYPLPQQLGFNLKARSGYVISEDNRVIETKGGTCEGNSGGPVVDMHNSLVGVLIEGIGSSPCSYYNNASKIIHLSDLATQLGIVVDVATDAKIYDLPSILSTDVPLTPFFVGLGTEVKDAYKHP